MSLQTKIMVGVFVGVLVVAAGGFFLWRVLTDKGQTPEKIVSFVCDQKETIEVSYYAKKVMVTLSSGRKILLPELQATSSAADLQYGNAETVFSVNLEGDRATLVGDDQNYQNCELLIPGQPVRATFASSTLGFSIKYPDNYTVLTSYAYDQFGPKKLIAGVKFLIPESMATGTNLSLFDTGISVESLPRAKNCTGDIYLPASVTADTLIENDIEYSVASSTGAAAGNRYEEIVYAVSSSSPCLALRYFIHSSNIGNYATGTIREFDRSALLGDFDQIRHSLKLGNI